MTHAIRQLAQRFGPLLLLPVVRTTPTNMVSKNDFLNSLMIIHSNSTAEHLKATFNTMEEAAGRDRSDPARGQKDRPLDIDIIAQNQQVSLAPFYASKEPYCLASLTALEQPNACIDRVTLSFNGSYLTSHRAATIDTDHSSGHILVVEDTINSLLQRLETAFNRQ